MPHSAPEPNRRDFLRGEALRAELERLATAAAELGTAADAERSEKEAAIGSVGDTLRLAQTSMACEFEIVLNRGDGRSLGAASSALQLVDELEAQLTVYRDTSELLEINRRAGSKPVVVEARLFDLLRQAQEWSRATAGAFDLTSGPLIALWRACRAEARLPRPEVVEAALRRTGWNMLRLDAERQTVEFTRPGLELNLGAIGKGYALDRAAEVMRSRGAASWLMHAGHSSLLAEGDHAGHSGWPVRVRNPLLAHRSLATMRLIARGMSTSGNGVQFFRVGGERYGHLLDPRTGIPVTEMLSVTVVTKSATEAEALSTAFFVFGVEMARQYCHNHPDVGAILIPQPTASRLLEPIVIGLPRDVLFFDMAECADVIWDD